MQDFNISDIVNNQVKPIDDLVTTIRDKANPTTVDAEQDLRNSVYGQNNMFGGVGITPTKQKFALEEKIPISEGYDLVGDEYLSKFPTYKAGRDNTEYAAQTQSAGEKWSNGLLKFGGKTLSAVVGGTYGVVNGIGAAINEGSMSALYDNDFSNWMSDLDTKMNYQLPNYYTKQEQDLGVFGQVFSHNFWSDKFLGGLSFTAGLLVSEGIWAYATGGTSLATLGARFGNKLRWGLEAVGETTALKGITKYANLLKTAPNQALTAGAQSKTLANAFGKAGEVASLVTFTARSAGYEASVEALQYKREAEEKFYRSFGEGEPTAEEIAKFNKDNESAANAVFGTNIAIVGSSNLILMGHILNIKNPIRTGLSDFIDRKAFGYGLDKATGKALERTTRQKVLRNIFDYGVKPGVTEGLFEEGLQGVTNKTANKWIEHTYDPKKTNETFTTMEAMYDSLAEQYGSEEGWKENVLGILIGIAGGSVNVASQRRAKENEIQLQESVGKTFDNSTLQSLLLPNRIQTANRIAGFSEDAKREEQQGNISKAQLAKQSAMLTYINQKQILGESISDTTLEIKNALDTITVDQWKEAGIEADQIEQEKTDRISEFNTLAKTWKTNKTYWQYMIGKKLQGEQNLDTTAIEQLSGSQFSKNAFIVEALTWQSTVGENANKLMADAYDTITNEVGSEMSRVLQLKSKLSPQPLRLKEQIRSYEDKYNNLVRRREELTQRIAELTDKPVDREGFSPRVGMSADLLKIEKQISEISSQVDAIAEELNATTNYEKGLSELDFSANFNTNVITGADLLNLNRNIDKFKSVLNTYETANPQKSQYLTDLLDEYTQAETVFLESQATQKAILSPDFKMKNIEGWLRGKMGAGKEMNENTQEWLQNTLSKYSEYKIKGANLTVEQTPIVEQPIVEEDPTQTKPKTEEQRIAINNVGNFSKLSEQQRQELKNNLREQVAKLPNDVFFLTHLTQAKSSLKSILKNGLNTGVAIESTTNVSPNKQDLIDSIEALIDGKVDHAGSSNLVVLAFPRSILPSENVKKSEYTEAVSNYIAENYVEDFGKRIPQTYNVASFTDGNLDIVGEEKQVEVLPTPITSIEQYKDKLVDILTNYDMLYVGENYDEIANKQPTESEIEEYKKTGNKKLENKLKDWRLLDASIDGQNNSVVDYVKLIKQLETEIAQNETKDEVTDEEIVTSMQSENLEGSGSVYRPDLGVNVLANATVKASRDGRTYELTHIKAQYIVDQIGGEYTINSKRKAAKLDNLKPGESVTIDGMTFEYGAGGRLKFKKDDLLTRAQQLNLYVIDTKTVNWSFPDVYTVLNNEWVKMPSQFKEDNLKPEESYNSVAGDALTLVIDDVDGWNKNATKEDLKIFMKDKDGNLIQTLKAGREDSVVPNFENLRQTAFDTWERAGRPSKLDLGISVEVDGIFLGSPEFNFEGNVAKELKIDSREIIAKGYVLNGEIVLDNEIQNIDKTYIGQIYKKNPTVKQPIIVFKKGAYNVAFPISMVKKPSPINFDALLIGTPQEMVLAVNESIIKNGVEVEKLTYNDIQIVGGQLELSDRAEAVKEAFTNNQTFTSADQIADKKYDKKTLETDATIKIDLTNLDKAISSPKVRIKLDNVQYKTTLDVRYESQIEVENRLSELAIELSKDYAQNASTKYVDSKGDIIEDTAYTNAFDDSEIVETESQIQKVGNLNILRQAFSEKLTPTLRKAIGEEKVREVQELFKQYDFIKSQTVVKDNDGSKNICK